MRCSWLTLSAGWAHLDICTGTWHGTRLDCGTGRCGVLQGRHPTDTALKHMLAKVLWYVCLLGLQNGHTDAFQGVAWELAMTVQGE